MYAYIFGCWCIMMPFFFGSPATIIIIDEYLLNCSGAGPHLFKSWATYLNRSIILTPEVSS